MTIVLLLRVQRCKFDLSEEYEVRDKSKASSVGVGTSEEYEVRDKSKPHQ